MADMVRVRCRSAHSDTRIRARFRNTFRSDRVTTIGQETTEAGDDPGLDPGFDPGITPGIPPGITFADD
jgi:hypothetical protein